MKSFPNIQMLLIGAVTLALGAAAVPVALGILELGHLRGSIAIRYVYCRYWFGWYCFHD